MIHLNLAGYVIHTSNYTARRLVQIGCGLGESVPLDECSTSEVSMFHVLWLYWFPKLVPKSSSQKISICVLE